jgi:hypothetical protein
MFAYVHNHSISHIDLTGNWDLDVKLVLVTTVCALALTRLAVATSRAKLVLIPVVLELINTALIAVYMSRKRTRHMLPELLAPQRELLQRLKSHRAGQRNRHEDWPALHNEAGNEALEQIFAGSMKQLRVSMVVWEASLVEYSVMEAVVAIWH